MDTLGTSVLSIIWRLSLFRRFQHAYSCWQGARSLSIVRRLSALSISGGSTVLYICSCVSLCLLSPLLLQHLRQTGVVGKFVEFFGPGVAQLSIADRATISNMCPEYGATMGYFPVDNVSIKYLRQTGTVYMCAPDVCAV